MPKIVVVGGGFAGFNAALSAARTGEGACEVVLVSLDPWLTIRPRLYEREPHCLRVDLREPLAAVGAQFARGSATALQEQALLLESGERVPFDRLIVATGSVMRYPDVAGARTAYSIDDYERAVAFDSRLASLAPKRAVRIAVVGAGFTGVELALEMRDRIAAHAGYEAGQRAEIHLIDRAEVVGAELGPGPRPAIEAALKEAGVTVTLCARIASIQPDGITWEVGGRLPFDAVVLCTGLKAAPFVDQLPGPKDAAGRVNCGPDLKIPGLSAVFAAGDACCAMADPGHQTLLSCQHALMLGKYAGENAVRDVLGLPLVPYSHPRYVTCLALGRSGAVYSEGWDRRQRAIGAEAKAIKTRINTQAIYPASGGRDALLASSRLPG